MSVTNLHDRIESSDNLSLNNASAPVVFVQSLQHQVNEHDIQSLIQSQKHMLVRFEKTNEMLMNCNGLMATRFVGASKELKKHIVLLVDLKKDLESIFRRIRFLKMKLSQQYSEAFSASSSVFNVLDEEEEQEEKDTQQSYSDPPASSSSSSRTSPHNSSSTSDT